MALWQVWVWQHPNGDTYYFRVTTAGTFYLFWEDRNRELVQVSQIAGNTVNLLVDGVTRIIGELAAEYREGLVEFTTARLNLIGQR